MRSARIGARTEGRMTSSVDPMGKVTEGKDLLGKIRNFLSGFVGYVKREDRREADKLLRESIALRYETQWARISAIQRQLIGQGLVELLDDLEGSAIKLRGFIDRVKGAAYGYAGFFDSVRVNQPELDKLYAYDLALLENAEKLGHAVDNVESSIGSDGLAAAIRNLVSVSQEAVDAYDRRDEVILST
jgi:hypothetical protein